MGGRHDCQWSYFCCCGHSAAYYTCCVCYRPLPLLAFCTSTHSSSLDRSLNSSDLCRSNSRFRIRDFTLRVGRFAHRDYPCGDLHHTRKNVVWKYPSHLTIAANLTITFRWLLAFLVVGRSSVGANLIEATKPAQSRSIVTTQAEDWEKVEFPWKRVWAHLILECPVCEE